MGSENKTCQLFELFQKHLNFLHFSSVYQFFQKSYRLISQSPENIYNHTVIDLSNVCKTMEIWGKVCQNRDLVKGLE